MENDKVHEQKHPLEVFFKKVVLKNFSNFTAKHLCWSLFLIKLQNLRPATLLKRDFKICFPVKFAKFLRTPTLKNICERLLLHEHTSVAYLKPCQTSKMKGFAKMVN